MAKGKVINYIREFIFLLVSSIFLVCLMYACASVGSPQGGPVDETPPRFVSSNPLPNALNYNKGKIEIEFDELITVDNPMEKVIITPPQIQIPVIKAQGRRIIVELKDSLQPNTTYTIDFADAIADNNEKNLLENFTFAFSTGEVVDSLVVAGTLLNAENLEPMPGVLVGLHKNLEDTAFTKLPFFRTSKTNERGKFRIRNIAPGSYRLFALGDVNRDYKFDQPGEEIAFHDSIIVPSFVPAVRMDTVWKDSVTVDTIMEIKYNRFIPDNVDLFLFKEPFSRQYLRRAERKEEHKLTFSFNAPVDSLPVIRFLDIPTQKDFAVLEYTEGKTALNYWLKDSLLYKQDTLNVEISYLKSDSLNHLVLDTDTASLFIRRPKKKEKEKKKKKDEVEKIDFLGVTSNASGSMDVFDTLKITFSEPILEFDPSLVMLQQKIDTTQWDSISFKILVDEHNPMVYRLLRRWDYGKEYKVSVDSAMFTSVYGKWNDKLDVPFKTNVKDAYGHLYVSVLGVEGSGIGELLDASDKVVRRAILKEGGVLFMNLKPGKYYLRYIVDTNGNGMWDTGQYGIKRQPEQVFYYPEFIEVMQNWEHDETWNVHAVPISQQKPLEITKNKPKEKKKNVNSQGRNTNTQNAPGQNGSRQNASRQSSRFISQDQ